MYKRLLAYRLRKASERCAHLQHVFSLPFLTPHGKHPEPTAACAARAPRRYALGAHKLLAEQPETLAQWELLYRHTDAFTQGWLTAGIRAVTGAAPVTGQGQDPAEVWVPAVPIDEEAAAAPAVPAAAAGGEAAPARGDSGQPSTSGREEQGSAAAAAATAAAPEAAPVAKKRRRRDSLDRDEDAAALGLGDGAGDADGDGDAGGGGEEGGAAGGAPRRRPPPPEVVNVLVTAGCLLPTLAKLILFKLDKVFPLTHGASLPTQ